jgi:hypothetical protein
VWCEHVLHRLRFPYSGALKDNSVQDDRSPMVSVSVNERDLIPGAR